VGDKNPKDKQKRDKDKKLGKIKKPVVIPVDDIKGGK
jgi:hypothetical protein